MNNTGFCEARRLARFGFGRHCAEENFFLTGNAFHEDFPQNVVRRPQREYVRASPEFVFAYNGESVPVSKPARAPDEQIGESKRLG
jgi:hypothetical protein